MAVRGPLAYRIARRGAINARGSARALDPRGEVRAGGYVIHLSNDGGKTWDGPHHTGFAAGFPFTVRAKSSAPAFDGEVLQLPVDVREVDPASITFPPVGLQVLRDEPDRIVRIPLAVLLRDGDDDTLTDLVEERLATDPGDKDTDDDGTPDAFDRAPLEKPAAGEAGMRFAARVLEHERPAALVHAPSATRADPGGRTGEGANPLAGVVRAADPRAPAGLRTRFIEGRAVLIEEQPNGTLKTTTLSSWVS